MSVNKSAGEGGVFMYSCSSPLISFEFEIKI